MPPNPDFRPNYPGSSGEVSDHLPLPSSISLTSTQPRSNTIDSASLLIGAGALGEKALHTSVPRRVLFSNAAHSGLGLVGNELLGNPAGKLVLEGFASGDINPVLRKATEEVSQFSGDSNEERRFSEEAQAFLGNPRLSEDLKSSIVNYGRRVTKVRVGKDYLGGGGLYAVAEARSKQGLEHFVVTPNRKVVVQRLEPVEGWRYSLPSYPNRLEETSGIPVNVSLTGSSLQARPLLRPEIGSGAVVSDTVKIYKVFLPLYLHNSSGQPEPTPTPTPEIPEWPQGGETIWSNEGTEDGWDYILENGFMNEQCGGVSDVIPDPAGGTMIKGMVSGGFSEHLGDKDQHKRRAMPVYNHGEWLNPVLIPPPFCAGALVNYDASLKIRSYQWLNLHGLFGRNIHGENQHLLSIGIERKCNDKAVLLFVNPDGTKRPATRLPGAPDWRWNDWVAIGIVHDEDGCVVFYQSDVDGIMQPVEYGYLDYNFVMPGGFGFSWGLYCGTLNPSYDFPPGAFRLLKDSWVRQQVA